MSVKVDIDELAGALQDFGYAYLITVGADHRAHAIAVQPVLTGGVFHLGAAGATTSRNLKQHDAVTLLWPPREPGGYSLIVDGTGTVDASLTVTPQRAVLHRPAGEAPAGPTGCPHDCVPLETS